MRNRQATLWCQCTAVKRNYSLTKIQPQITATIRGPITLQDSVYTPIRCDDQHLIFALKSMFFQLVTPSNAFLKRG